jgi:hypothetical protein
MILLGMTGPIGHGKTTFANALAQIEPSTVHLETSEVVIEVANALHGFLKTPIDPYDINALNDWLKYLPSILLELLHIKCNFDQIKLDESAVEKHPIEYQKLVLHVENLRRNFTLAGQAINSENKEAYRPILQWLGGYLVERIDSGIWWNEIIRRAREHEKQGCQLLIAGALRYPTDAQILRKAGGIVIKVYRPGHLQSDTLDPTERERDNIQVDSTVMSNGTVDDVRRCATKLLADIKNNDLQTLYQTMQA